ncbi:hypothetical protein FOL47_007215 [Perkinsus chesapeaki]|uniref:Reverse transcriptase domain-containing protein n=1 Tax=Perkinsus chesapeaki TaxID=330153 RepID=A0A7J6LLX5_PERCH|nr:hypothetical protein FOL47_007215 [Perkinsus chesapeaki]
MSAASLNVASDPVRYVDGLSLLSSSALVPSPQLSRPFRSGMGLDFPPPGSRFPDPSVDQQVVIKAFDCCCEKWGLYDLVGHADLSSDGHLSDDCVQEFSDKFNEAAIDLRATLCSLFGCVDRPSGSGSPIRAPLWIALIRLFKDDLSDSSLAGMLDREFPTGIVHPIPLAGNLPPFVIPASRLRREPHDLRSAFSNYLSAQRVPTVLRDYVEHEVKLGRMVYLDPTADSLEDCTVVRVAAIAKSNTDPSAYRLVEDYRSAGVNRRISTAMCPESISLPGLTDLKTILRRIAESPIDYLGCSLDFKDAYRHIVVSRDERQYMCVRVPGTEGECHVIAQHVCLPFGLRSAGLLWVRLASSWARLCFRMFDNDPDAQLMGFLYIDDCTLFIPSRCFSVVSARAMLLASALGLRLNWRKTVLFASQWRVLGYSVHMGPPIHIGVPQLKADAIAEEIRALLQAQSASCSTIRRITGRLTWAAQALALLRPYLARLHGLLGYAERHHLKGDLQVGKQLKADLRIWLAAMGQACVPIFATPVVRPPVVVACDASIQALGGVVRIPSTSGCSPQVFYFQLKTRDLPGGIRRYLLRGRSAASRDMTVLELLSAGMGITLSSLRCSPAFNRHSRLTIFCDSSPAAHALSRCYSSKKRMCSVLRSIALILTESGRLFDSLDVRRLKSEENFIADAISRLSFSPPEQWVEVDPFILLDSLFGEGGSNLVNLS